jgi:autotransporter-associated beta strand protein
MNFRSRFAVLFSLPLFTLDIHAQSVWNGGGLANTNWSDSANWTSGTLPPNNYTGSIDFTSASAFTSTVDTTYSLYSLTIYNGAGALTLNNSGGQALSISSALTDSSSNSVTISAPLQYTMGLFVSGTGTLTLSGTGNTFTGNTLVSSGTLADANANAFSAGSALIVGSGGTVDVNFSETVPSLDNYLGSGGSVVVASGATLIMNGGFTSAFPGVISGAGGIEKDVTGTLILTGANSYTGTTVINGVGGTAIQIGNGGTSGSFASSGVSGTGTLGFNRSNAYTYAGNLTGALQVVQAGTGTTTLSGTNTYSGPTTVNGGILQAGSASAFGGATGLTAVTVNGGTTLDLNGFSNTIGSLAGSGAVTLGGGTLTVGTGSSNTLFSGAISGGGLLNSVGYILDITGINNTYAGGTSISNGKLLAENASGFATGTGPIVITSGALEIGNSNDSNGYIDPASNITVNGTGSVSFSRGDTFTFANNIAGTGGVGQYGSGTVILSGTNSYSGVTTIYRGTMKAGSTSAFGGPTGLSELDFPYSSTLDLNGFSNTVGSIAGIAGNSIILGSQTLTVAGTSGSQTFAGNISGTGGSLAITGSGGTQVLDGVNTYTGGTAISAGATLSIGDGNATGASLAGNVANNGTLQFAPSSTDSSIFSGIISGSGVVNILGTLYGGNLGAITLSGNNTYVGGTNVLTGELFVGSNTAVGSGTLTFDQGTELSPSASVTLANPIVLNGTGYVDNDDGGSNNLTLNGQISGTNGIAWCTWSTLTLTGNNTFQYGIDMRDGVLLLGSDTAAGTGTILLDTGTTLSALGTGIARAIPNAITMVGSSAQFGNSDNDNITISGVVSSTGTSATTYAGGSGGTLTLTANNSGLTGPFTISSGTVVAGNNNALGASADNVSLTGSAGLNVMNGVTISNPLSFSGAPNVLSGNGTIASPAPVTINGSVVLSPSASPGNGPGNLTFTNSLTFASGGAIHFELYDANGAAGTGYSEVTAAGGLNLTAAANTITFNLVSVDASGNPTAAINFNPASPYSWMFATSATAITGFNANQINLITTGFANGTAGGSFSFTESGNDLFLNFTPVPEPSTWALMGSGLAAVVLGAFRRRRLARV